MNTVVKWALIGSAVAVGTAATVGFIWVLFIAFAFGAFDRTYSKADLITHYEAKAAELWALSTYVNSVVPARQSVEIEFEGLRTIRIFHVQAQDQRSLNWDVAWGSPKADSLLHTLGWTRQTLATLQKGLDRAGCISIASGEPCTIGFQRSGMGKYSFNLFARTPSDTLQQQYKASCTYIPYQSRVFFEYGGGAIGSQCFPSE